MLSGALQYDLNTIQEVLQRVQAAHVTSRILKLFGMPHEA